MLDLRAFMDGEPKGDHVSRNWVAIAEPLIGQGEPVGARVGIDYQRAIDLIVLAVATVALTPLMVVIALAIWISDGGPIFFGHVRVGKMGRTFRCWKFRSMVVDSEQVLRDHIINSPSARQEWELNHKLRNDPRITPVGRLLRSSSLDELPQLWNVFVGEMSLVGPRPIVVTEIERYQSHFLDYCSCLPGITGLWQISGRNDTSYQQRVALDVQFARSRSLKTYFYIIGSTIPAVLRRRGAY